MQSHSDGPSAEKLKFLGMVSHELKTPLNAIIGFSEMIKTEALGPVGSEDYKEYAREIEASGRSLLRLIEELIQASKIEEGAFAFREAHLDLAKVVGDAVARHAPEAERRGVILQNLVNVEAGAIWGDVTAIGQALSAIVDNAVKFAGKDGLVSIEQFPADDGGVAIVVGDTGRGIAEEKYPDVFALLTQVDDRVARTHEGLGLGLYLARTMMELHGGRVELQSSPGDGARFALVFPADRRLGEAEEDDLTIMADDLPSETFGAPLEILYGGETHRIFQDGADFVIGRLGGSDAVDLVLEDRRVSRPHARIVFEDGAYYLVDQSKRGSYVVGEDGRAEFVNMDVSAPLSGEGQIALGDPPDVAAPILLTYKAAGS